MPSTLKTKGGRMQIRIDDFSKNKIERAAQYEHKSLSDFVILNALAAANRVIEEHDKITLSDADWEIFYQALINPPQPNQALKEAFADYLEQQNKK